MNDKDLYQQKKQAQLDEWQAEIDKLKARASMASADAQLEMNKQITAMESHIKVGKAKLTELAQTSEEAWGSIKLGVDSAWDAMKSAVGDAAAKFKR
jgi:hypothetical protein